MKKQSVDIQKSVEKGDIADLKDIVFKIVGDIKEVKMDFIHNQNKKEMITKEKGKVHSMLYPSIRAGF